MSPALDIKVRIKVRLTCAERSTCEDSLKGGTDFGPGSQDWDQKSMLRFGVPRVYTKCSQESDVICSKSCWIFAESSIFMRKCSWAAAYRPCCILSSLLVQPHRFEFPFAFKRGYRFEKPRYRFEKRYPQYSRHHQHSTTEINSMHVQLNFIIDGADASISTLAMH